MNVEVVKYNDGKTYAIVYENEKYVYLSNVDDVNDVMIQKKVKTAEGEYFTFLDENEFDEALQSFSQIN